MEVIRGGNKDIEEVKVVEDQDMDKDIKAKHRDMEDMDSVIYMVARREATMVLEAFVVKGFLCHPPSF